MEAFEDLDVWKRSARLAVEIHRSLKGCREYSLKEQIMRSAISISSNIAEGFERNSNKQVAQFLYIAKGSCGELRSQLRICLETGLLEADRVKYFISEAGEISKMIYGLISHCRRNFDD